MAAETFDFSFALGSQADEEVRLKTAQLGDGYVQEVVDGINALQTAWPIVIHGDHATIIAARDFLRRNAGGWFWWRPPLEEGPVRVKAKRWQPVHTSVTSASLVTTFERVYAVGE